MNQLRSDFRVLKNVMYGNPKFTDSHTRHIRTIHVRQVISMQSKGVANAAGHVASVKNKSSKNYSYKLKVDENTVKHTVVKYFSNLAINIQEGGCR